MNSPTELMIRVGYRKAPVSSEFRALFVGQSVSIAGMSVAGVALTVLVYRRTGSPFFSALTLLARFSVRRRGEDR